jgi:hypothetical protein
MRNILLVSAAAVALCPVILAQQTQVVVIPLSDSDIQVLRSDIQAAKNDVINHTMQFTDAESAAFWPVYRDYVHDMQPIADKRVQAIKDYLSWADTLDETKANDLAKRALAFDRDVADLRQSYWPRFLKALGPKRAIKFYQVDNRVNMIANLQLTAAVPLMP